MSESESSLVKVPSAEDSRLLQSETEAYAQSVRGRLAALPFSMGLILLGVLLLIEDQIDGFSVSWAVAVLVLAASLIATNVLRFFVSGRRERGLLFLALILIAFGITIALMNIAPQTFKAGEAWPIFVLGVGVSFLVAYIADKQRERGYLGLALLSVVVGLTAFAVTLDVIPSDLTDALNDYYPLILTVIGITLIPLGLRRSSG